MRVVFYSVSGHSQYTSKSFPSFSTTPSIPNGYKCWVRHLLRENHGPRKTGVGLVDNALGVSLQNEPNVNTRLPPRARLQDGSVRELTCNNLTGPEEATIYIVIFCDSPMLVNLRKRGKHSCPTALMEMITQGDKRRPTERGKITLFTPTQ